MFPLELAEIDFFPFPLMFILFHLSHENVWFKLIITLQQVDGKNDRMVTLHLLRSFKY